jgi:hypothetical protein
VPIAPKICFPKNANAPNKPSNKPSDWLNGSVPLGLILISRSGLTIHLIVAP